MVAELARGGMGIVHLAEARGPGGFEKLVVVKELKRELADDPVYTAMFLDEARLAARLSHRHIVQTNEVGCEGGRYFMALELLEGGSLAQVRAKLGLRAMPVNIGVRVLAAVLDALHHAHELTDGDGRRARRRASRREPAERLPHLRRRREAHRLRRREEHGPPQGHTQVGVVKGSIPYMSPDHVDGSAIDRRADVFAVGVILREMLVGERLWGDADDLTILRSLIAPRAACASCLARCPRCRPAALDRRASDGAAPQPTASRPPPRCATRSRPISPRSTRAARSTISARGSAATLADGAHRLPRHRPQEPRRICVGVDCVTPAAPRPSRRRREGARLASVLRARPPATAALSCFRPRRLRSRPREAPAPRAASASSAPARVFAAALAFAGFGLSQPKTDHAVCDDGRLP